MSNSLIPFYPITIFMKLSTICLGVGIALSGLVMSPAAKAYDDCNYYDGYRVCYEARGSAGDYNLWNIYYDSGYEEEYMNLVCDGKNVLSWSSQGDLSQLEADRQAEQFCSI